MKQETKTKKSKGFSEEEKAAMKEYVHELRTGAEGESVLLAKIDEMKEPDKTMAKRLHAIIKKAAPALTSRTWYGMPAYSKDDKVLCFFQSGAKFKTRYATFGFSDKAKLDDGNMWPNSYALKQLTATEEAKIVALLKKAMS